MIETPNNLTRNILLGLFLGFLVASFFYYTNIFPTTFKNFIQEYIFNLGGDIFLNLLKSIDKILVKISPDMFCMGRRLVLFKR